MKNLCNKRRDVNEPYEIWQNDTFEWRVLKKYQGDDSKPFATWYCAVKSPFTHNSYEYGDVYVNSVKSKSIQVL